MKVLSLLLASIALVGYLCSCTDNWDTHYSQNELVKTESVVSVSASAIDYLNSDPSLDSMYKLFAETTVLSTLNMREQVHTILVVDNDSFTLKDSDDKEYLAKSHVSNIALSPANLIDGQRVLMWNGKYLTIGREELPDGSVELRFNGTRVSEIIKVNDGFIYKLDSFVNSPRSMYELIESLDDDYSIFREMILSRNQRQFNREASLPIGVDNTGSTIYDSVFVITNPYFTSQGFDLMSESLTATLLLPSDEVINEALNSARENLKYWNLTRTDSIIENWIFQSAFFDQEFTKQNFIDNEDLTSIFDKQWRTTIQKVDLDNPIQMSNGTAYYVNWMKIPTNVLIYRIKDFYKWYEFLSEADKNKYFEVENLVFNKCNTDVAAWSGWPAGGFPTIENRVAMFNLVDKTTSEFVLNFTPFQYKDLGLGAYEATPYLIPEGEYDLCLGFKQKLGHDVEVYCNDDFVKLITTSELTSTNYHYDRGGQGYPEGYDVSKATDSKKQNYDRDGQRVGVIKFQGEPSSFLIRFIGKGVSSGTTLHHWCLKPTKNCY